MVKNDFFLQNSTSFHVNGVRFSSNILKDCSWENAKQSSSRDFFQNLIISITFWVMPSWKVANKMNHTVGAMRDKRDIGDKRDEWNKNEWDIIKETWRVIKRTEEKTLKFAFRNFRVTILPTYLPTYGQSLL